MSADNGIYIGKFPDGYRVVHAQAIEDIDYFPQGSKEELEIIKNKFGYSQVYPTKNEAVMKAHEMELEILSDDFCPILEYGVSFINRDLPDIRETNNHQRKEK